MESKRSETARQSSGDRTTATNPGVIGLLLADSLNSSANPRISF
jgi:hypothetical protein